jgi:dTDP-4-amino-4,6-dideoxygalactose transaminase
MFMPPQPRFRFYNGFRNYRLACDHLVASHDFKSHAVEKAERRLAEWLDVGEVILTPQGRYAIYLGLQQTVRAGQHVIMSPYTLYDVVNMVVAAGGIPVFADIEEKTCNISPEEVERLIGPETGAVLVTHLHGLVASIEKIKLICESHRVPLLEDACQAFGARLGGRKAGTLATMGFFSFGRAKNINAFLGGMIATNDSAKAMAIRNKLAQLPHEDGMRLTKRITQCAAGQVLTTPIVFSAFTYWFVRHGVLNGTEAVMRQFDTEMNPVLRTDMPEAYERRMTSMQATLIHDQIAQVDAYSRQRMELAQAYSEGLQELPAILLPPLRNDFSHIYLSFPIQVRDRGELQRYMMRHGRDVAIQHIGNAADYPCFARYHRECPHARQTAANVLLLPTYPGYRLSEARKNIQIIHRFFDKQTSKQRLTGQEAASEYQNAT